MPLRKAAAAIKIKIEQAHQEQLLIGIPGDRVKNQLPGSALPPTGNTGSGYTPDPDAVTRIDVRKNSAGTIFSRRRLNLIEGTGATLTVADDSANEEVDVTIAVSGGTGTVTSVSLTAPGELTVTGSPITSSGTIALTWTTESANRVFAGPTTGIASTPAFRALVANDIPDPLNAHGIRTAIGANAAGLYVPWITGDTLTAAAIGSSGSHATTGLIVRAGTGLSVYAAASTGTPLFGERLSSAVTSAIADLLVIKHTAATPASVAAGYGASISFQLSSTTTAGRTAAKVGAVWSDPADATFTGALTFYTALSAAGVAERMRLTGVGALWIGRTSGGLTGNGDLDVLGNGAIGGGLNLGTATGASAGQLRMNNSTYQLYYDSGNTAYRTNAHLWSDANVIAMGNIYWGTVGAYLSNYLNQPLLTSSNVTFGQVALTGALSPPRSSGTALFAIDGTSQGSALSIANNGTATPFGASRNFSGLLIISETAVNGTCAVFVADGGTAPVLISNTGGALWTVTSGTASRTNVYLVSGAVTIENKLGSTATYNIIAIRTRTL